MSSYYCDSIHYGLSFFTREYFVTYRNHGCDMSKERPWLAKIMGDIDPKYGIKREFLAPKRLEDQKLNLEKYIFKLELGSCYEFKNFLVCPKTLYKLNGIIFVSKIGVGEVSKVQLRNILHMKTKS